MKHAARVALVPLFLGLLAVACSGRQAAASGESNEISEPSNSGLGRVANVAASACTQTRPSVPLAADATPTECHTDADCTTGRNGRCMRVSNHGGRGPSLEASTCSYDACFSDADCGSPRAVCLCAEVTGSAPRSGHLCVTGDCATDADCGASGYCRRGPLGKYCHSPADQCVEETRCGEGRGCAKNASGIYECAAMITPLG